VTQEEREALRQAGDFQITIGILIASLCGLCSGAVLLSMNFGSPGLRHFTLGPTPLFGGLPILVGVLLIVLGYGKRADADREEP
jgi:UDP-N-acetylmuramyl pentapeptide phosphotransferase/UDP-N-acetylglucosamine-1-phosphate transferase